MSAAIMPAVRPSPAPSEALPGFEAWLEEGRAGLRKGGRTRLDLLLAGARCLAASPLDALTVAAVCQGAGVAHGTFYLYFADRNALVGAVLEAFVDYVQLRMHAAGRADGDAARNTTSAYMAVFEENAGLMKCLVVGVDAFPEARAAFQRLNHDWAQTVLRAARRAGASAPEDELMRRAYALGGMVDQYLAALFVTNDPWLAALSENRAAVLETLTELWTRGMNP